jgi:hypothetical protein
MKNFSWKNFGAVMGLTLLVGIAQFAVAWQFNDGKMSQRAIGAVVMGMALPSLLIGGVMRLFRPDLQRYFALTILICFVVGLFLIFT